MGTLGLNYVILHKVKNDGRYHTGGGETNHTSTPLFVKELGDRGRQLILDWFADSEGGARCDDGCGHLIIGEIEGILAFHLGLCRWSIASLWLGGCHLGHHTLHSGFVGHHWGFHHDVVDWCRIHRLFISLDIIFRVIVHECCSWVGVQ